MRILYREPTSVVFMQDETFEQIFIPLDLIQDIEQWLMEEVIYDVILYKGKPVGVQPPTFMEMVITETDPGARGDTSGRVLKPAITETGAKVQIPIFIDSGTKIKVDTRTGEYVSRV